MKCVQWAGYITRALRFCVKKLELNGGYFSHSLIALDLLNLQFCKKCIREAFWDVQKIWISSQNASSASNTTGVALNDPDTRPETVNLYRRLA